MGNVDVNNDGKKGFQRENGEPRKIKKNVFLVDDVKGYKR
jgi:hypothetical protein